MLPKKKLLPWLYTGGALLLLVAAGLWCYKTSIDPERVFWKTIERSLSTRAVTIDAEQTNNGVKAKQVVRYSLGADNLGHTFSTLSQEGTTVQTEMIGTTTTDYTRYVRVVTDQKKPDGTNMDFSKLIGVWAKSEEGAGQVFAQSVFGASLPIGGMGVPVGKVPTEARAKLIKQAKDDVVYQTSFSKTKKERVNGRLLYTYEVTMRPSTYVALMKGFSQSLGLHGLDDLSPDDYKAQKPFKLLITVDVRAHQVVTIAVPDTGSKQSYSGYDVPVQAELPKQTVTTAKLSELLSEAQQ